MISDTNADKCGPHSTVAVVSVILHGSSIFTHSLQWHTMVDDALLGDEAQDSADTCCFAMWRDQWVVVWTLSHHKRIS